MDYEVISVEANPSGGFIIKWKRNDSETLFTSNWRTDDVDEAVKYVEDKASEVINIKTKKKVKELKDKFKQKGVMK